MQIRITFYLFWVKCYFYSESKKKTHPPLIATKNVGLHPELSIVTRHPGRTLHFYAHTHTHRHSDTLARTKIYQSLRSPFIVSDQKKNACTGMSGCVMWNTRADFIAAVVCIQKGSKTHTETASRHFQTKRTPIGVFSRQTLQKKNRRSKQAIVGRKKAFSQLSIHYRTFTDI